MSYYGRLMDAHLAYSTELRFERQPNVPHFSDGRGWVTHRVTAHVGVREVGHVSLSHVPRDVYDAKLADPKEFVKMIGGYTEPTDELVERLTARQRKFEAFHVDSVHVAYVHVEPEHRRRGIARRLYLKAARWMGEKGLVLASSDQQTYEALKLWRSLDEDPDVPTVTVGDGRRALDFT